MNVGFEKIKRYVGYRLKDVNENIERYTKEDTRHISFNTAQILLEEKGKRKELEGLLDYIKQITASVKEGNL